jgi:hypothetical protein
MPTRGKALPCALTEASAAADGARTTLTRPMVWQPFSLASRSAARVSAVSPDWEITITMSSGPMMGSRYRNSDAYSTYCRCASVCWKQCRHEHATLQCRHDPGPLLCAPPPLLHPRPQPQQRTACLP